MNKTAAALLPLLLVACDGAGRTQVPPGAPAALSIGGVRLEVSLLLAEKDRRHASELLPPAREGKGYLLSWPRARFIKLEGERGQASFDVAFLDKAGVVVDLQRLVVGKPEGIQSEVEAAHALLAATGALSGAKKGDKVDLPPGTESAQELPVVKIGPVQAWVELSTTYAERNHGMMFRSRISPEDGMLFSYPEQKEPGMLGYWMKNTLIPLDIAFFSADGTLINVVETPIYPDPRNPPANYGTASSEKPAKFVLEMRLGWFREKGLVDRNGKPAPGLKAEFPRAAVTGRYE